MRSDHALRFAPGKKASAANFPAFPRLPAPADAGSQPFAALRCHSTRAAPQLIEGAKPVHKGVRNWRVPDREGTLLPVQSSPLSDFVAVLRELRAQMPHQEKSLPGAPAANAHAPKNASHSSRRMRASVFA